MNVLAIRDNLQFFSAPFGAELSQFSALQRIANTAQLGIGRRFFCATTIVPLAPAHLITASGDPCRRV